MTEKTKIGVVLKGFPRISETFINNELLLLEKHGFELEIYSLRKAREPFSHENVKHIKATIFYLPEYILPNLFRCLPDHIRLLLKKPLRYLSAFSEALVRSVYRRQSASLRRFFQAGVLVQQKLVNRENIPFLYVHFIHSPSSVAAYANKLCGIPFGVSAHAKDIYTSRPDQLKRKLRQVSFVTTCTSANKDYLEKYNETNTPIYINYHGINIQKFKYSWQAPEAPPYRILSVGRFVEKKGYDVLLNALQILKQKHIPFIFNHAGSGELEEKIKQQIKDLGLEDCCNLLGTRTHEEIIDLFRTSHCFALACRIAGDNDRDGVPNVLVEAMAVGIPVISTDTASIPELVTNNKTGILVEPENPEAFAQALETTLANPEKLLPLSRAGRSFVEQKFDNTANIPALVSILKKHIRTY